MTALSDKQSNALFNFLTHTQTILEIQSLKVPGRVSSSGHPFKPDANRPKGRPLSIINFILRKFGLTLPGFKDVGDDLWRTQLQTVLENMASSDLSDSYDRGIISRRKIVAFGISVVTENTIRGALGGLSPDTLVPEAKKEFSSRNAQDVQYAWKELLHKFVYGKGMEEIVEWAAKTDKLEELPLSLQTAHQYATVTCASFLHYLFAINPAGPAILTLFDRIHQQLPYGLLRQTLRACNPATVMNAVLNVFLYHYPSVRGLFNGNRGKNLLQSIISSILSADKAQVEKRLQELNDAPDSGSPEQRAAIHKYVTDATRDDRLEIREQSATFGQSIVTIILTRASVPLPSSSVTHEKLLRRLTLALAVRDRERMIDVLCNRTPDHLSDGIRIVAAAFDPIIRQVHKAVDLSTSISDVQTFFDDLIRVAKDPASGPKAYLEVLHTHQKDLHHFLHLLAKNSPELKAAYMGWYRACLRTYKRPGNATKGGAGALTVELDKLVSQLGEEDRKSVLAEIDAYAAYLDKLNARSDQRMKALLEEDKADMGPGVYLGFWEDMINKTGVTPAEAEGSVRYGAAESVQHASESSDGIDHERAENAKIIVGVEGGSPDMSKTWKLLRTPFEDLMIQQCT